LANSAVTYEWPLTLSGLNNARERLVAAVTKLKDWIAEQTSLDTSRSLQEIAKLAHPMRREKVGPKRRLLSLAWARKNTARAADIGIAGLFIVGIAVLVIDHDRFAACLAGMVMFRCSGRLD
jgi:hypothetical protein